MAIVKNFNFKKILKYPFIIIPFFSITIGLLYSNFGFYSFAMYKPRPEFWDLNNSAPLWKCYKVVGLDLFKYVQSPLSPLEICRNFNYGYLSMLIFGLISSIGSIVLWGFLQIAIFHILVSKIYFQEETTRQKIFYLSALFSPGIFLLYASGNMDLQILCLLLLANYFLVIKKEKSALSLICITTLLKFYTAPILFIIVLIVRRKSSIVFGSILIFFTASIILYQLIKTPLTPFGMTGAQNKFGSEIFGNYARKAGVQMSQLQGKFLGLVLISIALTIIIFYYKKFNQNTNDSLVRLNGLNRSERIFSVNFLIMGGTSIVCFFATLNVDYRLTFVALAGMALFKLPQITVKYISKIYLYCWSLSLWIVFPFAGLKNYIGVDLQPIGDLFMIPTIAYFIFQGYFIIMLVRKENQIQR